MPEQRDCLFLVADSAMGNVVDGFLSKGHFEGRIGCRQFEFDFDKDVLEAPKLGMGADGGIYKHCHRMLQENGYMESHRRLVVLCDQQFGSEVPAAEVRTEILDRIQKNGWGDDKADVVVIDPELEIWIWQDSPHVQKAIGFNGPGSLRELLREDGSWPDGRIKPSEPKELFRQLCHRYKTPFSSALYRDVAENVSALGCSDPAFKQLLHTLCRWFPIGDAS